MHPKRVRLDSSVLLAQNWTMNTMYPTIKISFAHPLLSVVVLFLISANISAQSMADQGSAFLKENGLRENVQVTESGLQYLIITPGNDMRAGKRDKVLVHYQGKNIHGEVFDSSFGGDPFKVKLSRVIDGWTEGLQLIGEGGRIALFIPPELAYGRRGSKPLIGRNETLIFIIDLLEITSRK